METTAFDLEYTTDTRDLTDDLLAKVQKRLEKLSNGHKDITGASLAVDTPSGDSAPRMHRVRLVLYHRPENIAAVRKDASVSIALHDVLDAVERQVRQQRARLRGRNRRK